MADQAIDELREAARNRGLKLLRSRKRKPGVGDYGKLGLSDEAGKPVFGVNDGELTATAAEVWDYLRRGLAATWRESANTAEPIVQGEPPATAKRLSRPTKKAARSAPPPPREPTKPPKLRLVPPPPPVELVVRRATPKDAAGLSALLAPLQGFDASQAALTKAVKKGDWAVADRGDIVGCVAWTELALPLREPLGRIGLLYVAEKSRNEGIGRQLVDHALADLAGAGCCRVEVMSAIDIRNSHEFFRRLEFSQASYRFVREIKP